jgi:pentatricopeptide repeat protein
LLFSQISTAQNGFAINRRAYQLLLEADALKSNNKNCVRAIEIYEQSLALKDFRRPSVYQSLASCYAQTGNREKAFFYLDRMLAVGWIDDENLRKDADLKTLLAEPRGKKFSAKLARAKIKFAKEIAPETYGIADNPAIRQIEIWGKDPKISAAEFFRLVSDFNEFPQPKKTGVFVKFTNRFSDKISPRAVLRLYSVRL